MGDNKYVFGVDIDIFAHGEDDFVFAGFGAQMSLQGATNTWNVKPKYNVSGCRTVGEVVQYMAHVLYVIGQDIGTHEALVETTPPDSIVEVGNIYIAQIKHSVEKGACVTTVQFYHANDNTPTQTATRSHPSWDGWEQFVNTQIKAFKEIAGDP